MHPSARSWSCCSTASRRPNWTPTKNTPNFDRLKREGAWSRHLVPAFPTISMTNHATFETGCWPEHHGIMSNIFYDPVRGRYRRRQCRGRRLAHGLRGDVGSRRAAGRASRRCSTGSAAGRRSAAGSPPSPMPNVPWTKRDSDDVIMDKAIAAAARHRPQPSAPDRALFQHPGRRRALQRRRGRKDAGGGAPLRCDRGPAHGGDQIDARRAAKARSSSAPITA